MRLRVLISAIGLAALSCMHSSLAADTAATAVQVTPPVVPTYTEETKSSGITNAYNGEWQFMVGGGAATFDCNDDGYPDVFLAGGETPAKFYRNVSTKGGPLKFVEEKSGLELDKATGAYPMDVDGDGIQDLIVLRVGENIAMRGVGGCKFERANEKWGFDGGDGWSTAFSATFEKGANWPTLAVGNYVDRKQEAFPWGSCTDNWLHRPSTEPGKFAAPLPLKPSFCALSILFTDWNRSGTPSLRVSNDREYYKGGQEQMWKMEAGKPPVLLTEKDGWKKLRIWGMGIASTDINGDGYPDYFLTSMADNKLQSLAAVSSDGKQVPTYADIAFGKGVTAFKPYMGDDWHPSTAWHAQFEDVNNDGLADLFIAKGNVAEMPDFARKDPNNLLLQGTDGKFVESGDKAGVASMATSRGGALTDFNLDGLVDLVVTNRWESAQVWRNTSTGLGHFIEVKLSDTGANRDGIGSWLEVKTGDKIQRREITVGGGHAGGQIGWWHVGLGSADKAEVRVLWSDGTQGEWETVTADQFYVLPKGKKAEALVPAASAKK